MFVALPVRQQKDPNFGTQLAVFWGKVRGDGQYFNINPIGDTAECSYIDELRKAKRRGTARVVKAILKERSKAS